VKCSRPSPARGVSSVCRRGEEGEKEEEKDGKGGGVGLCNVCDYVGNYSHLPCPPSLPPALPETRIEAAASVAPSSRLVRRRKGCNSLLARNGSSSGGGGGGGDYSPRSRFADDDKRDSADPIAVPTRPLPSLFPCRPSAFVLPLCPPLFLSVRPTFRVRVRVSSSAASVNLD
jgi:hypothetical protein